MREFIRHAAVAALVGAVTVLASPSAHAQSGTDAVAASLLDRFEVVSGNLLAAAERIPEEHYSFKPTEDVRSVAEQITHVAGAHFAYCAGVGGDTPPAAARGAATTKAEIVERMRASRDFCLGVYRRAGSLALGESVTAAGSTNTRVGVLIQNIAHDNLHYGNVVTYMRLLGLVPPSSE